MNHSLAADRKPFDTCDALEQFKNSVATRKMSKIDAFQQLKTDIDTREVIESNKVLLEVKKASNDIRKTYETQDDVRRTADISAAARLSQAKSDAARKIFEFPTEKYESDAAYVTAHDEFEASIAAREYKEASDAILESDKISCAFHESVELFIDAHEHHKISVAACASHEASAAAYKAIEILVIPTIGKDTRVSASTQQVHDVIDANRKQIDIFTDTLRTKPRKLNDTLHTKPPGWIDAFNASSKLSRISVSIKHAIDIYEQNMTIANVRVIESFCISALGINADAIMIYKSSKLISTNWDLDATFIRICKSIEGPIASLINTPMFKNISKVKFEALLLAVKTTRELAESSLNDASDMSSD